MEGEKLSLALALEREEEEMETETGEGRLSGLQRKVEPKTNNDRIVRVEIKNKDVMMPAFEYFQHLGWKHKKTGRYNLEKLAKLMNKELHTFNEKTDISEGMWLRGGDTLFPEIAVISFPGRLRLKLFYILESILRIEMRPEVDNVFVYNSSMQQTYELRYTQRFRRDWMTELDSPEWEDLMTYLATFEDDEGDQAYKRGYGPEWFAHLWGLAAWDCVQRTKETGCGIICFKCWPGYMKSPWCKLEWMFARILSKKYPKCCYVVTGYDTKKGKSTGYYMTGNEKW